MKSLGAVEMKVAFMALASLVLASPVPSSSSVPEVSRDILLVKRTDPNTAGDLVEPQVSQVEQGFKDAIELCSYVFVDDDTTTPILEKYFNSGDHDTVLAVFNQIMGNPSDPLNPDPTGSSMLGSILVQKEDTEGLCTGRTLSYMGDPGTDNPFIVVCDPLFQHGSVDGPDALTCDSLGDNVSYKMMTVGATFIHEYTHWNDLVESIVGGEVIDQDNGYGPVNVRNLDKGLALKNADSYAYFASELLWTIICGKTFADPRAGIDDDDPACGGVCQS